MIKNIIKLLRVSHWVKNSFVFVPMIFAKYLMETGHLLTVTKAAIAFSLVSSVVYIVNDIIDIPRDRLHPVKRNRPLASGALSISPAIMLAVVLGIVTTLVLVTLPWHFAIVLAGYVIINLLYSLKLKQIVIVDIICISTGFMLRVIGGAVVIDVHISKWLILTTLFISLFLAAMKRRSELVKSVDNSTRKVLADYSVGFIDQITTISAAGVIICYALYSVADRTVELFHSENIVFTTIFVVFGIFRYMHLGVNKREGENTIEVLIRDIPMIINIMMYIIAVVLIIYL